MSTRSFYSERGFPLACTSAEQNRKVLTIELYEKWYALQLLEVLDAVARYPNYQVTAVTFDKLEDYCETNETAFGDHVPNPMCVQRMADAEGWLLDDLSLEIIIGRWELEHNNNYHYVQKNEV